MDDYGYKPPEPMAIKPMEPSICTHGTIIPYLDGLGVSALTKRAERARAQAMAAQKLLDSMSASQPFSSDVAVYGRAVVDAYWKQRREYLTMIDRLRLDLIELASVIEDELQDRRLERSARSGTLEAARQRKHQYVPKPKNRLKLDPNKC